MKFALIITGSPVNSQACHSALRFCQAALENGHDIYRIFLLDHAAQLAHINCLDAEIQKAWQSLEAIHKLDIVVCVNSARMEQISSEKNLANGFVISGMGQLIDASVHADRLVTFGH